MADNKKNDGRFVLYWILGFFLTFMAVDSFFVYKALKTHRGTVELSNGK